MYLIDNFAVDYYEKLLYPSSTLSGQLRLVLSDDMMKKYQERLQDESIKMAELPDLVKYA